MAITDDVKAIFNTRITANKSNETASTLNATNAANEASKYKYAASELTNAMNDVLTKLGTPAT